MNFVFNDENFQQNLTNQYLQQILQLKSIYGTILSQNEQSIQIPFQTLLLQQLLQLQQTQQGGGYHDFYNQNSSITQTQMPFFNTEIPPEYPQFYQFPRIYNAQIDQLNQFQDPKCKYNLGSKKDKDKGVDLNTSNCTTQTDMTVGYEQQLILNQSQQQLQIGNQDIPKIPKPLGFQRVSKKYSAQSEQVGIGSQISQSAVVTQLQEVNFSLAKAEEQIIRDKSETIVDSASISGTKSPVFTMLSYLKNCDQEVNSQQETACEPLGTITMNKQSSNKKDTSEDLSCSTACQATQTISSSSTLANSQYQSLINEWDFQKLKNITDPQTLKDIAEILFKNQIQNAPLKSQSQQILQEQHSQFTSSTLNQFYDQLSQGKKTSSFTLDKTQSSSSSTPSFQLPQSSSTSSSSPPSTSSCYTAAGLDRNLLRDNCNLETDNAITTEEPSQQKEKKKDDTNQILKNINEYLESLKLKINFKQNENYDLIISKNFTEKQGFSQNVSSHQSSELRDAFDNELLAASTLNQINASLLEQEDAIIEEGILQINSQGSSSDGTDEENQHDNEAYEPVKVKKRSGKAFIAPLEQQISEKQSSSPVLKPSNDTKNENCIQAKDSMANKSAVDQSSSSNNQNRSSVQDTFMNARRNKKREQKIQQTIEQNSQLSTKFHNLTRLLMYKIIQIFKDEANLRQSYNISPELSSSLKRVAGKIKQHSRDTCKSSVKTNFYTHSHYNALFLTLNEENVKQLALSQKDVDAHKFIFGLDLTNASAIHLTFANIVKNVAYEIVKKNLEVSIMKEQISNQQQMACQSNGQDKESMQNHISNLRSQYFQRAFQGITKMSNGQIVSRF